jgi:hypothetical protein
MFEKIEYLEAVSLAENQALSPLDNGAGLWQDSAKDESSEIQMLERGGADEQGLVFGVDPQLDAVAFGRLAGHCILLQLVLDSIVRMVSVQEGEANAGEIWFMTGDRPETEIAAIRQQLQALDLERQRLAARLGELERACAKQPKPPANKPAVANSSPAAEKIALFRRLFAGRTDVFPVRWQNPKTGRSGYAPACANEWVRGVCGKLRAPGDSGKPQIKRPRPPTKYRRHD